MLWFEFLFDFHVLTFFTFGTLRSFIVLTQLFLCLFFSYPSFYPLWFTFSDLHSRTTLSKYPFVSYLACT